MNGYLGAPGYSGRLSGSEHFPSPFMDMASTAMPETLSSTNHWAEYIYYAQGTYRQAIDRIVAYFLTDIEIGAAGDEVGDDEKEKWKELLEKHLSMREVTQSADRDLFWYGNAFLSFVVPFKRFLVCPKCKIQLTLEEVFENSTFGFKFSNFEFHASCPKCRFRGAWDVKDEPSNQADKLRLKRWSPHEMKLLHDPFTEETAYLWDIPEDYKRLIRNGKLYHLQRVSQQVLKAIKNNQLFRFAPDVIFHMKEQTLAGINNRGWGISRLLSNFRQVWYVQVLHRYNEAIALDYIIPFRLITPAQKSQAGDPLLSLNLGDAMPQLRRMIAQHRRDPATWHTLGFPVEYQALGGDATKFAPFEMLNQGMETLLNAAGVPVELYKGTLQLQTAPVSLRLFEATWLHMVHANNSLLDWVVRRVSDILNWESVEARHRRVTHADDMQKHMAVLQMAMGGAVSMTSALKALGLDYVDEQRNIMEEARTQQEMQADVQKEMEQAAFGQQIAQGGMAPGTPGAQGAGAPPAAAGGTAMGVDPTTGQPMAAGPVTQMIDSGSMPQTPEEMMQQAESLAQQLLGLPESQKDSELRALKTKNETMHALVRAKLDQIRGQARQQGGAQLLAQTYGG